MHAHMIPSTRLRLLSTIGFLTFKLQMAHAWARLQYGVAEKKNKASVARHTVIALICRRCASGVGSSALASAFQDTILSCTPQATDYVTAATASLKTDYITSVVTSLNKLPLNMILPLIVTIQAARR
jgi:hypothetical protein